MLQFTHHHIGRVCSFWSLCGPWQPAAHMMWENVLPKQICFCLLYSYKCIHVYMKIPYLPKTPKHQEFEQHPTLILGSSWWNVLVLSNPGWEGSRFGSSFSVVIIVFVKDFYYFSFSFLRTPTSYFLTLCLHKIHNGTMITWEIRIIGRWVIGEPL